MPAIAVHLRSFVSTMNGPPPLIARVQPPGGWNSKFVNFALALPDAGEKADGGRPRELRPVVR
jgi:hypothetical protein